jgi:glutathione S-transferase
MSRSERTEQVMIARHLELVSHHLCPYVQRAVITLAEKATPHDRTYVDLTHKPDWFNAISPLGKAPLLRVRADGREAVLFESAVICEYLDETTAGRLHPDDPLERGRHRAWIEFASAVLDHVARFYRAEDEGTFAARRQRLVDRFTWLEQNLGPGPYFAGERFSLVDAAFGPLFRYFDVFERIGEFGFFDDLPAVIAYRQALAERPSVRDAVGTDYPGRLVDFLRRRGSYLSALIPAAAA